MTDEKMDELVREIKDLLEKYNCNIIPTTSRDFKEDVNSSGVADFQLSLVNWKDQPATVLVCLVKQVAENGKLWNLEYNGQRWRSY